MNTRQRQQTLFLKEWVARVKISRLKIGANVLVCLLIFYIGITADEAGLAISAMAFVQSVNLPEMVSAYQETKQDTRIEQTEPPEKYR